MAQPLVSVVVPTKNSARFLGGAIASILSQDYPDLECIVVDGGSSDNTIEILKSYGTRIDWLSEPDRGAFDAINKGWRRGHGDILAWLNADDCWEEGAVLKVIEYFDSHPKVDVLYGSCGAIDAEGYLINEFPPRPWNLITALENCDHIINQAASFLRRRIVEKVDYLYPAWCHDHDLWLRIALAGGTFAAIPDRLASARVWPGNLGNNPTVVIPAKISLTRRFFDTPGLPRELQRRERRAMSNAYLRGMYYLNPGKLKNWPLAAKLLWKAASADPRNIPYLVGQVLGQTLNHFFVTHLLLRVTHGIFQALSGLGRRILRRSHAALFVIPPVISIGGGIAVALAANPPTLERAVAVFFYASMPLTAMLLLFELGARRK